MTMRWRDDTEISPDDIPLPFTVAELDILADAMRGYIAARTRAQRTLGLLRLVELQLVEAKVDATRAAIIRLG